MLYTSLQPDGAFAGGQRRREGEGRGELAPCEHLPSARPAAGTAGTHGSLPRRRPVGQLLLITSSLAHGTQIQRGSS